MKTSQEQRAESTRPATRHRAHGLIRKITGGLFLFTGGIHLGIVMSNPQQYAPFADEALVPFITEAWTEVFMAQPAVWGSALCVGEATLGILLLRGGTAAKLGWLGVLAFHLGLMVFGWGFWLWSVPFLALVLPTALHDLRAPIPARHA